VLVGVSFRATLLRASITRVLLFRRFSVYCSAIRLFDFVPCSGVSGVPSLQAVGLEENQSLHSLSYCVLGWPLLASHSNPFGLPL
jgi:hypothetical protein